MSRYRITLRGVDVELRGYVDGTANLQIIAQAVDPMGLAVVASPAPDDYNPFVISQPEYPPTVEKSREVIESIFEEGTQEEVIAQLADLHYGQALVIRGERGLREWIERDLARRELHHFETEQMNEKYVAGLRAADEVRAKIKKILDTWDTETNEATQGALVAAIKAVLP